MNNDEKSIIKKCAQLLRSSGNVLVLTGAGISTESGIPDFRSPDGLYSKKFRGIDPETIVTSRFFFKNPQIFYDFTKERLKCLDVKPGRGHVILAAWESAGIIGGIATQNIDGLHQKAGSRIVLEVHGTMRTATCQGCGKKYDLFELIKQEGEFYRCLCDNERKALIKPDVVLFGEPVPKIEQAFRMAAEADMLLILGTSLLVYPFAQIPAWNRKIPAVIINYSPTPFDRENSVTAIHAGIGDTLEQINNLLER